MTTPTVQPISTEEEQKRALNKRLEAMGWGLFLIMLGCNWLIPDEIVPEGTWLIGAGLIMLGLNLARYLNAIKMSSFTIGLGVIAVILGLGDFFGWDLPFLAILLIVVGAGILLRPILDPLLEKK